jgi:hypothetical protein
MFSIIIFIAILIICILGYNLIGTNKIENFFNLNRINNQDLNSRFNSLKIDNTLKNNNYGQDLNSRFNSLKIDNRLKNNELQQIAEVDERILFNNRDYNENLSIDNKNNKYFYNDTIDQSNINETAFNIVYSIDPIDYSNVETGIQKCNGKCNGLCFENGYDGIATCYPKEPQGFDWGTLYKNPTFTYGYNAFGPNNLPK